MARKNGSLRLYKSYMFRDKDPIIDAMRTTFSDSGMTYSDVEKTGGATATTLRNWFAGKTRRPQFCTIAASARAMGMNAVEFNPNGPRFLHKVK